LSSLAIELPETEARALIRLLHDRDHQDAFPELYGQLQKHFFEMMTISEFQALVGEDL